MRLTLRTLLAYLDNVLEPADRDQLQQQIDSSDVAKELVHRVGDVTRRLRLGAPEVLGSSLLDDPNTVAEYLDNVLEPDRVAEFEKGCLESDALLAEAAACHHVLTMVLNRPAEVDPDTLQRMHALEDALRRATRLRIEPSHRGASVAAAIAPAPVLDSGPMPTLTGDAAAPAAPRAPDYLKQGEPTPWGKWALAAAAVAMLAAVAYTALGPNGALVAKDSAQSATPVETADEKSPDSAGDAQSKPGEESSVVAPPAPDPARDQPPLPAAVRGALEPVVADAAPDGEPAAARATDNDAKAPEPAPPAEDTGLANEPAADGEEPATEGEKPKVEDKEPPAEDDEEPVKPAPGPASAGVYVGPALSMLVEEREPDSWWRLATGAKLPARARLLSLPTYRPRLDLVGGTGVELAGPADVTIDVTGTSADESGSDSEAPPVTPRIEVRYGKTIVANLAESGSASVELALGDESGLVTLEAGAAVALDVERVFTPGIELRNESPPVVAVAYAPTGRVRWAFRGADLSIDEPSQWMIVSGGRLQALAPYGGDPGWLAGGSGGAGVAAWDADASGPVAEGIAPGAEAWPALEAFAQGTRRKELRALADRCAAAVGHPEALVRTFDDPNARSLWRTNLDELRRVAGRSTEDATRAYEAFVSKYGSEQGAILWRLVIGYSPDEVGQTPADLRVGAVARLLDSMDSESLAERALANLNLEELTGLIQVYSAVDSPSERRVAVNKLRRRLKINDLPLLQGGRAPTGGAG
jgi:hypothetical protein